MKIDINNLPKGDFSAIDIANKYYPNAVKCDSEGRCYNMAIATVYRILRKTKGVIEIGNGIFYNGM